MNNIIQKNSQEQIHITKQEFKDKEYIDIRTYYLDSEQKWKPTRKGVCIDLEKAKELVKIITKHTS